MPKLSVAVILVAVALAACGNLPNDGPTVKAVEKGAAIPAGGHYALVPIDYRVIAAIDAHPARPMASLLAASSDAPTDIIGEGDTLAIGIYQPGAGPMLIGGGGTLGSENGGRTAPQGAAASAETEALPRIIVGRDGVIDIPFAGAVKVSGLTPPEAAQAIRRALHGRAVNPQVIVSVLSSPSNSVTVIGEVKNTGRYPVGANDDRLLDAIAAAGGVTRPAADLVVSVIRAGHTATIPMAELMDDADQNIRLAPGDEVRITAQVRNVNAFGALGKVSEIPMVDDKVTLATILSRAGGLDTNSANATAVFLFRYERPEVADALGVRLAGWRPGVAVPIVYRLDLKDPTGYFLASKFQIEPDDLVDIGRSNLTQIQKFFTLINTATLSFYQYVVIGATVPKI